ncbi:hypothetical protein Cylst_1396 [Cylindrospermum stagnale PCC 7417]|uniref:Uncharacterized protein n=1 Tax=Cylindrospermum stagnale PCC 7417 TaxID=56107 RepID=K9WV43_9NOST|nr:hypothetical protein [Cylindrospermum stagnale]AFZ23684.1 hypothetical protein Cylst_1396 [Cylindrospermum stagnale PCC 7417]
MFVTAPQLEPQMPLMVTRVPTPEEAAMAAQQQASAAELRLEQEQMRSLGVDPDNLS